MKIQKKLLKALIVSVIICVSFVLVINIPIFRVNINLDDVSTNSNHNKNICILKYQYTTGASWQVIYDSQNKLENQNVALYSIFDPRWLKDNIDFEMDYMASYIVVIDKSDSIMIDNQKVTVIYPENIIINFDTDKRYYKIKDISFEGILKSLIGVFNKKYRICY